MVAETDETASVVAETSETEVCDHVDANLRDSDEFMMAFERAVTELAWGWA